MVLPGVPPPPASILVVFGSMAMNELIRNWVSDQWHNASSIYLKVYDTKCWLLSLLVLYMAMNELIRNRVSNQQHNTSSIYLKDNDTKCWLLRLLVLYLAMNELIRNWVTPEHVIVSLLLIWQKNICDQKCLRFIYNLLMYTTTFVFWGMPKLRAGLEREERAGLD